MIRFRASETLKIGIVATILLISVSLFSFKLFNDDAYDLLKAGAFFILLVIVAFNTHIFLRSGLHFKPIVLLFLFLPLLSVIGAYVFHDQPVTLSLLLFRYHLFWLFYFALHILDVPKEKVLKLMLFAGCAWAFFTVVQQFTYPIVFFYTKGEGNASLHRANVLRFGIAGQHYGAFVLMYFFYKYLTTKKIYTFAYILLALLGFYYYGFRQLAAASLGCMVLAVWFQKGIAKWGYLILFTLLGFLVIVIFKPTMITHWIELTNEQVNNEDYVRYIAIRFYTFDYWPPHWSAKFFGNGQQHMMSPYGEEMEYITKSLGLWRSDIGIFGTYNLYGALYILNILWVSIKGLTLRFTSHANKYLKLPFWYVTVLLPLNVAYTHGAGMCFFCLLYYLVDKSLNEKEAKESLVERILPRKRIAHVSY